jgi:hypothetical protein
MAKLVKSFTTISGSVIDPAGFRSVSPARAKLVAVRSSSPGSSSAVTGAFAGSAKPRSTGGRVTGSVPRSKNDFIEALFPFGPKEIKLDSLVANIVEIDRPGKKPILFRQNSQLRTVSFEAVIADKASGGVASVDDFLDKLTTLADYSTPCKFIYGLTSLTFAVVLTQLSINVTHRNNSGAPVRADVSIQLTECPYITQEITSLQAVVQDVPPPPTPVYSKPSKTNPGPPPPKVPDVGPLVPSLNGSIDPSPPIDLPGTSGGAGG